MASKTERFQKLTDKFFTKDVVWHLAGVNLDSFGENQSGIEFTDYPLKALVLPAKTGLDAMVDLSTIGKADITQGILYFYWNDLVTANLITGDTVAMQSNKDFVSINSVRHEVIGIAPVGPDEGTQNYVLVKVFYRKELQ